MAVAVTGSAGTDGATGTGTNSTAFTIPSDAEAVCVWMVGNYASTTAHDFDILNWDNGATVDFTQLEIASNTGSANDIAAYIMTTNSGDWPGTGSKTLYWSWNASVSDGGQIAIQAIKGLDTTTPKRDSDSNMNQGNPYGYSPTLTGVDANDLMLIMASNYAATTFTEGAGQTVIYDRIDNTIQWSLSYESGESSPSADGNTSGVYGAGLAIAIRVAAAAGGRIMSSCVGSGGLAGEGGIAGSGGGLAG